MVKTFLGETGLAGLETFLFETGFETGFGKGFETDFETGFEIGFESDKVVLVVERSKTKNGSKRSQGKNEMK